MEENKNNEKKNFSFSLNKQNSILKRKINIQEKEEEEKKDFISGFNNSGKLESIFPEPTQEPLIIPMPQGNKITKYSDLGKYSHLIKKKIKTEQINIEESKGNKKTIIEKKSIEETSIEKNPIKEKLEEKLLEKKAVEELVKEAKEFDKINEDLSEDIELPILIQNRNSLLDNIENEEERFRMDVASRSDESTIEDYERVPIELFGKALLRGMGWKPGGAIGKTNAKVVEVIEFKERVGWRTGLGADVNEIEKEK